MRVTAQPFGFTLADRRAGKWHAPKIFDNEDACLDYFEKWWVEVLDKNSLHLQELDREGAAANALSWKKPVNLEAHTGEDFLKAYKIPQQNGLLLIKTADRFNA